MKKIILIAFCLMLLINFIDYTMAQDGGYSNINSNSGDSGTGTVIDVSISGPIEVTEGQKISLMLIGKITQDGGLARHQWHLKENGTRVDGHSGAYNIGADINRVIELENKTPGTYNYTFGMRSVGGCTSWYGPIETSITVIVKAALLAEDLAPLPPPLVAVPTAAPGGLKLIKTGSVPVPAPAPTPESKPATTPEPKKDLPVLTLPGRPAAGTGLEPFIPNPVELIPDWEVWWTRNRLYYLPFKKPFAGIGEKTDTAGKESRTVARRFDSQKAFDFLVKSLADKHPNVRATAAFALAKSGNKDAIPHIKKIFTGDKDFNAKNISGLSLAVLGDTGSIDSFKEIINDKKEYVVSKAYAALALGYLKDKKSVDILKETLDPKKRLHKEIQCSALLALGNLRDESVVSFLEEIINDRRRHEDVRAYATLALGRINSEKVLKPLTKMASVRNPKIRASAAISLGLLKSPDAKTTLLKLLKKDKSTEVRSYAAIALAQSGIKDAAKTLTKIVRKRDFNMQGFALLSLGILGDEKAAKNIRKSLGKKKKKGSFARDIAALSLGLLKDKESVPGLIAIVEKEKSFDSVARQYAILALGMIGDESAVPVLEKTFKAARSDTALANMAYNNLTVALSMLGKKKEVLNTLYEQLKDPATDQDMMLRVLNGIGYLGDESSIAPLIDYYGRVETDTLRMYAVMALGFVLDKNKISPLYKITADNNINIHLTVLDYILASRPD